jgi:hypothetical protein
VNADADSDGFLTDHRSKIGESFGDLKRVKFGIALSELSQSMITMMFQIPLWTRVVAFIIGILILICIIFGLLKVFPDFFKIKKMKNDFSKKSIPNEAETVMMIQNSKNKESQPSTPDIPVIKIDASDSYYHQIRPSIQSSKNETRTEI